MGHGNKMLGFLERFGLTHLSQVVMVGATALGLATLGVSASQALLSESEYAVGDTGQPTLPAPDLARVNEAQLFGVASTNPAQDTVLPVTHLLWVLQAVFTGSTAEDGSAIILAGEDKAQLFKAKQPMPGGAELSEVHADHVVITRNGNRETLRFPAIRSLPAQQTAPVTETLEVVSLAKESIDSRREIVRQRLEMLRQRAMNRQ